MIFKPIGARIVTVDLEVKDEKDTKICGTAMSLENKRLES